MVRSIWFRRNAGKVCIMMISQRAAIDGQGSLQTMKVASRFPIAIHTLLCVDYFDGKVRTTSDFIAKSVNVNPVVIRQVLQKLKASGLVSVERGVGGAHLAKDPHDITLLDVCHAVNAIEGTLFGLHDAPNQECPVGAAIEPVLSARLEEAQHALEASLEKTTLADLLDEVEARNS